MQQHSHPWKHYDKAIHQALVREIRKRLVAFTYSNDPINQSRLIQLLPLLANIMESNSLLLGDQWRQC